MKLYYFDIYGRAEAIRMALTYAKVPFEDVRITGEDLQKMKAEGKLTYGQVPALELDGEFYTQSYAILRMLGKKYGLYPEDEKVAQRVDAVMDYIYDLGKKFEATMTKPTEEEKKEAALEVINGAMKDLVKTIDTLIAKNGNWHVVGDKLTIADIMVGCLCYNSLINEEGPYYAPINKLLEGNENMLKFIEAFKGELGEYLASRPKRPY